MNTVFHIIFLNIFSSFAFFGQSTISKSIQFYAGAEKLKNLISGLSTTKGKILPSGVKENVHVFEDESIREFPRVSEYWVCVY